jgi:hypothetical protein
MFVVTDLYCKIEYGVSCSFVSITLAEHKRKTKLGPGIVYIKSDILSTVKDRACMVGA